MKFPKAILFALLLAITASPSAADVSTNVDERVQNLVLYSLQDMQNDLQKITDAVHAGNVPLTLEVLDLLKNIEDSINVVNEEFGIR